LQNGHKVFLTFYADVPDPKWDGSYITIKDPGSGNVESLVLVEFERCSSVRFGGPNDEVWEGHPLAGKGLEGNTAQIIVNSRWKAEIEKINSVHSQYRPETWTKLNHYVFWFHDDMFECLAKSFKVERADCSMAELLAIVSQRLLA
jgi:hypothetical protein